MDEIIVIGAGASGLMASIELAKGAKKVTVLEAKERAGGRIHTIYSNLTPVELGAEFVHGDLELTNSILKKAKAETAPYNGDIYEYKDGQIQKLKDFIADHSELEKKLKGLKTDITIDEFIKQFLKEPDLDDLRFTLRNYVEGYYAADANRASTLALREELASASDEQYRIKKGYNALLQYLLGECETCNVKFVFNSPVEEIKWKHGEVTVKTTTEILTASKALITVPLGVLQSGAIKFSPAPAEHLAAANQLGYGSVVKLVYFFKEAFWKQVKVEEKKLTKMGFLFSDASIPTWWTHYPDDTPILTGWCGGPRAQKLSMLSDEEIKDAGISSLSSIFNIREDAISSLLSDSYYYNWEKDPYSSGAYSYDVVGGDDAKLVMLQPVENTLYFSGEALYTGTNGGTVEAALLCGRDMGRRMLADI